MSEWKWKRYVSTRDWSLKYRWVTVFMQAKRGGLRKSHAWRGACTVLRYVVHIMVSFDNLEVKLGNLLTVKEKIISVYFKKISILHHRGIQTFFHPNSVILFFL